MKKVLKAIGWLALVVVVIAASVAAYLQLFMPNVGPAPDLKVEITPQRIEHGAYLANHVVVCMDCHSARDFSRFSGPLQSGTLGRGGEKFSKEFGFPGTFFARNITPASLADWTDGEIYRVITTGVTRHGKAVFPVMPYKYYSMMDPEDVKDIIAYLRSIPAIENQVPHSKADFPFNFILNTIPKKAETAPRPDTADHIAYGRYLTHIAGCMECHTPNDGKGQKVKGMELAGGWEMSVGGGKIVTTANLTPDKETGLGSWTSSDFIAKFKMYADSSYTPPTVEPGEFQTIMPWTMYANMKTSDLAAIYAYLQSVPAVHNPITKFK